MLEYLFFNVLFLFPAIGLTYWSANMIEGHMGVSLGSFLTGLIFIAIASVCYYLHGVWSTIIFGMLCFAQDKYICILLFLLGCLIIFFGTYELGMLGLSFTTVELQNQTAMAAIFAFLFLLVDSVENFRSMGAIP